MLGPWIASVAACVLLGMDEGHPALPPPSGASPVGTKVAYLVDATRREPDFPEGRPITVQLWYPAESADSSRPYATYLMEPGLADALERQSYYGVDAATLRSWQTLLTNSRVDAKPGKGPHPLVTFSVGLGVARANYTTLVEELASHDHVVALVESPHAGVMLRDGRLIQATSELESPAGHRKAVDEWARDVSFALDWLQEERAAEGAGPLAACIDWKRVAAAGHSSGGLVAMQSCELEPRVKVGVNLDGGFASPEGESIATFVGAGTTKPALVLLMNPRYGPADFERRGLTREQWEARGAPGKTSREALAAKASAPLVFARVAGTGHFSFSDGPFVMPTTITRFGGDLLTPERNRLVITMAIRAFLEESFARSGTFDSVAADLPELQIERRAETR